MTSLTLTLGQRLEASLAALAMVGMLAFGVHTGIGLTQSMTGELEHYRDQARTQLDAMLADLGDGHVERVTVHRRCYGSDDLSPCVEASTTQGLTVLVMGPSYRLGVVLPEDQRATALALKQQADGMDQAVTMGQALRPELHPWLFDTTGTVAVPALPPSFTTSDRPVPLVPGTMSAKGFEARPVTVNGTSLWWLRSTGPSTQKPTAVDAWWFTVPMVMAGPVLRAMRRHPLAPHERLRP